MSAMMFTIAPPWSFIHVLYAEDQEQILTMCVLRVFNLAIHAALTFLCRTFFAA